MHTSEQYGPGQLSSRFCVPQPLKFSHRYRMTGTLQLHHTDVQLAQQCVQESPFCHS